MGIIKHKKSVMADDPERIEKRSGYFFVLIFVLMAIGIAAIGYFSYLKYQHTYRDQVERNLSVVANQKVDELVGWRQERIGDASIFFQNPVFTSLVRDFIQDPKNTDTRWRIQMWMDKIQKNFKYKQVHLFDTQGASILSVPANPLPVSTVTLQYLLEVLRSGQVTFQDFYWNNYDQHIYLAVLVPILDEKNHNQPLAVLALRINPDTYLYPLIQKWSTDSKTAEILLVRRDGNDALFLNELKFQKDAALKLRIPLEKKETSAVKAVLGQEGIVEGKDYRSVLVLACLRAVPDSPWFLVARMDTAEVYAPLRERLGVIVILVLSLLFGAAIGLNLLRRQQNLRFYRKQYRVTEKLRFFAFAVESSSDAIGMSTPEGKYYYQNKSFDELFGDVGLNPPATVYVDEQVGREVFRTIMGRNPWIGEVKMRGKTGELLDVFLRAYAIKDDTGKILGLVGVHTNITERKQAEEERNSLQEQLIRSEKLAAVGELIAGVVHEINNPLTGIKGLSELLLNETQDEEKKKDLKFIHELSERIEKIVKNLQRFVHREKPSRKYVNINELIDVVISIRDYEMTARNIKIERDYQPDLPLVFTDPSQLEQVFLNLITNAEYAIHDNQEKAGTLSIATSVVPDNAGGTVVIEFFDTGAGIPTDVLPKIFNPFFTTKGVGKGTGLGLSVSYGIIKGHGGEISARNRKEGGAVFTIKLPVRGGVKDD